MTVVPVTNLGCHELAVALPFLPDLKIHFRFTHSLAGMKPCCFSELHLNFLCMVHFTDVCNKYFDLFIVPEISFNSDPQLASLMSSND